MMPQMAQAAPPPPPGAPPQPQGDSKQVASQQTSEDVVKKYGTQLKALVDKRCRDAVDREKIFQYAIIRRNDFYFRGNQHLAPSFSGNGELVDFKPINNQTQLVSNANGGKNSVAYDYVINNFRGDLRKFVGVLGQKSPNVKARPNWASDESGIRRSNIANDCASYLRSQWDGDAANRYLVLSLGKNGTTFIHTPFVTDEERYGVHDEPVWGMQAQKVTPDGYRCLYCGAETPGQEGAPPLCQNCQRPLSPQDFVPGEVQQIPAIVGNKQYPNGTVELHVHSAYDVTTPFYIKDLEHCPWLWLEFEEDSATLVSRYPGRGLEEMIDDGYSSSESAGSNTASLGRLAREQASSVTGYTTNQRPGRWSYARFWLRPSMYLYLLKTQDAGQSAVDELKARFPRGMKLTFANKKLVMVEEERLDEVWTAVKPETSEYLYADAIFDDYIQGSDIMNDGWNILIQLMETSIPFTIYDPNVLDKNKIRQGFQPNEFVPSNPGMGGSFGNAFFKGPVSDVKPEIIQFMKEVAGTLREIIGLLPAVWGAEGVPNETAEASRRRLNQALMVLATTWNEMRGGWAKAYRNGVRQLARYSLGRLVSSQGDPASVTVKEVSDIQELLQGGWDFECDQAIPMNWTQLRDFVSSLYENPQMAQAMGAMDPDNLEKVSEGVGIAGWKIPGREERDAVHDLIGQLMQGAPIPAPPPPPPMPGQPPPPTAPPMPSIQLDFKITWTPGIVVPIIHNWLMSEEGRSAEGSPGYDNVVAAGLAALAAMAPPPPPPGAPHGPPPPGPPVSNEDQSLPESLPGNNAPTQPEAPLPPLPAEHAMAGPNTMVQ